VGIREKPRTDEKSKRKEAVTESPEVTSEEVAEEKKETHIPEVSIERTTTPRVASMAITEAVVVEDTTQAEDILLPSWGSVSESEWMYGIPGREEDKELWAEEWGDFLLQWAETKNEHVLTITTFLAEPPFRDMRSKVDAFKIIGDRLNEKDVAVWLDKKKRQLRIYWRPLEAWADIVFEWALVSGKLRLDVKSIVIQEADQPFAKLPESDLYTVLDIMVSKEMAEWVDKKKGAIKVVL
jgi:hypothetical protein